MTTKTSKIQRSSSSEYKAHIQIDCGLTRDEEQPGARRMWENLKGAL